MWELNLLKEIQQDYKNIHGRRFLLLDVGNSYLWNYCDIRKLGKTSSLPKTNAFPGLAFRTAYLHHPDPDRASRPTFPACKQSGTVRGVSFFPNVRRFREQGVFYQASPPRERRISSNVTPCVYIAECQTVHDTDIDEVGGSTVLIHKWRSLSNAHAPFQPSRRQEFKSCCSYAHTHIAKPNRTTRQLVVPFGVN